MVFDFDFNSIGRIDGWAAQVMENINNVWDPIYCKYRTHSNSDSLFSKIVDNVARTVQTKQKGPSSAAAAAAAAASTDRLPPAAAAAATAAAVLFLLTTSVFIYIWPAFSCIHFLTSVLFSCSIRSCFYFIFYLTQLCWVSRPDLRRWSKRTLV